MKLKARVILQTLLAIGLMELAVAHTQSVPKKEATPQQAESSDREMGKYYSTLRPEQKRLVDDFVRRYNQTTGSKLVPEETYDNARLSIRTTFDAVTHALLNAKITDAGGKNLGHAIDLVDNWGLLLRSLQRRPPQRGWGKSL